MLLFFIHYIYNLHLGFFNLVSNSAIALSFEKSAALFEGISSTGNFGFGMSPVSRLEMQSSTILFCQLVFFSSRAGTTVLFFPDRSTFSLQALPPVLFCFCVLSTLLFQSRAHSVARTIIPIQLYEKVLLAYFSWRLFRDSMSPVCWNSVM